MQPPDLFDEGVKRFDKLGEVAAQGDAEGTGELELEQAAKAWRPATLTQGESRRPEPRQPKEPKQSRELKEPKEPKASTEEMGLRKARFFEHCLRADRAFESPRLPAAEPRRPLPRQTSGPGIEMPEVDEMEPVLPTLAQSVGGLVTSCKRAGIPPATTGIIRSAGRKLQLQYGCLSDERAEAIALSLRASAVEVDEAHLSSNGLGERGAKHLLGALPEGVRVIDLSENALGAPPRTGRERERPERERERERRSWCLEFRRMPQLHSLNVSFSSLGDTACKDLCKALIACRTLRELNLSGNNIIKEGPRAIGNLVRAHKALEDLDVHFNHITGEGARDLVRGLHENVHLGGRLQALNLSWNPLGKTGGEETCKAFAQLFAESTTLTHLDISKCDLSFGHCQILAEGLNSNIRILGVHVQGNAGRMDCRGFLVPVQAPSKGPLSGPAQEQVDGPSHLDGDGAVQIHRSTSVEEQGTCCWVCDGWREICLRYISGVSGPEASEVWLFTSLDAFKEPLKMKKRQPSSTEFVLHLMAPAGTFRYIFQVEADLIPSRTAPRQRSMRQRIRRMRLSSEAVASVEVEAESDPLLVEVTSVSTLAVAPRPPEQPVCECFVPRRGCEPQGDAREEAWSPQTSLFAPYDEALVRRSFCESCFDSDWRHSEQASQLKENSERLQVKELFRVHYAEVKMLYASLCSVPWPEAKANPAERQRPLTLGISLHEFTHFLVQHNLAGDDLSLEEADALFIVSALPTQEDLHEWHEAVDRSGHRLLRHGFLDLLLRLAMRGAGRRARTLSHALEHLLSKNIMYPLPPMKHIFKCVQWRVDVLHTEAVESVYQRHMQSVVMPLFQAYSSSGPPHERVLRLEDWFELLDALQVLPCRGPQGQMQTWDRVWLWQISAMAHADELTCSGHLELSLVEFLEAIARLVGLLRSRQRATGASPSEAEKWDYGLGMPAAPWVFCCDKEGVMDKAAFAYQLELFLTSEALKRALTARLSL